MTRTTTFVGAALLALAPLAAAAEGCMADHCLALQISDNDPQKMNTVLNVAANATRHYENEGQTIEVRVVAFNAGLHMLRADTSPVLDRLGSFSQSMPNVSFAACGNTIAGMSKKEGKEIEIVDTAEHVTAGVVELMTLDQSGWTLLRP